MVSAVWMEIFKAGNWTDMSGTARTWSQEDLDAMVARYNGQGGSEAHEAPLVIGHPKDNSPAYGWVKEIRRDGDVLLARVEDVDPELVRLVRAGRYKKRSISLYPDMKLRHVGFLGGQPPAVKGLKDVAFSSTNNFMSIEVDMKESHSGDPEKGDTCMSENAGTGGKGVVDAALLQQALGEVEALKRDLQDKGKDFSEKMKSITMERDEALARLSRVEAERRVAQHAAFAESMIAGKRLLPGQKQLVIDLMEALFGVGNYQFSEGGQKDAVKAFQDFLSRQPVVLQTGELLTSGHGGDFADANPEIAEGRRIAATLVPQRQKEVTR